MTVVMSIAMAIGFYQGIKSLNSNSMGRICKYPNMVSYLLFYNVNDE